MMAKIYESPDKGQTVNEREFTIQAPPPPQELRESWAKSTYCTQRKDRLTDVIGDYLTDEDTDARTAYEEVLAEAKGWVDYHQKNLDKATEFYNLMLGYRPADINPPTSLG